MQTAVIETPLGPMAATADEQQLYRLEFCQTPPRSTAKNALIASLEEELAAYFAGSLRRFNIPLAPEGTPFQEIVWRALRAIEFGATCSYANIASQLGKGSAYRAVAQANRRNPIAILTPCHRVIYQDGSLGGYAGGLWRKQWLLSHEVRSNKARIST